MKQGEFRKCNKYSMRFAIGLDDAFPIPVLATGLAMFTGPSQHANRPRVGGANANHESGEAISNVNRLWPCKPRECPPMTRRRRVSLNEFPALSIRRLEFAFDATGPKTVPLVQIADRQLDF